jgi:hypothetical protein
MMPACSGELARADQPTWLQTRSASIRFGSNWGKRIKRIENHEDNMTTETAHRRADTSASKAAFIPCIVVRARLG